jgi:hypothetical protein
MIVASLLGVWLVVLFLLVTRAARAGRRNLRRCPGCAARAVRHARSEEVDVIRMRVALQCGQCGLWRRFDVTRCDQSSHSRRLERDRRQMRKTMRRLESARRTLDFGAFVAVLHSDIDGAEDFLAMTRPPRAYARRPRYPRGQG